MRRVVAYLIALALASSPLVAETCNRCGCKGGPGLRGPQGKCVAWKTYRKTCGQPLTTFCTPEIPDVTLRAELGLPPIAEAGSESTEKGAGSSCGAEPAESCNGLR